MKPKLIIAVVLEVLIIMGLFDVMKRKMDAEPIRYALPRAGDAAQRRMTIMDAQYPASDNLTDLPPRCACPDGRPVGIVGEKVIETDGLNDCTRERFRLHSPAMHRDIETAVLLPPAYRRDPERKFPILYALHGRGAPYLTWTEMAPLRRALAERPMMVVVFNGDKAGCYLDATHRPRSLFRTFFFDELAPFLESAYRADPAARGVTGFSMGGSGAALYAVERPDGFAGVSSLSSGLDLTTPWTANGRPVEMLVPLLGPRAENETGYARAGFFRRVEEVLQRGARLPPFFIACGTEDFALAAARRARDFLAERNVTLEYKESPGEHAWPYWRDAAPDIIDFHWRTFQPGYRPAYPWPSAERPVAERPGDAPSKGDNHARE